ncbi:hypothetical protein FGL86_03495 [Pistricoccus aurantiacus]|uniref:Uncharacterized protein n=1 Tax=Pistricoccus aurantiacus TaxID=1883414 RepID=A0A5B8STV6_9GAMM|nr:hypothetical protein [Pistricoccus aurantiacus]QEA38230.1 hypothetical protein FGL86_03495 [Pistricoccus aurantiacus]
MMRGVLLVMLMTACLLTIQVQAAEFVDRVGLIDKLLVVGGGLIVLFVTAYCIKCFLRPGERQDQHIKRRILKDKGEDKP